MTTPLCDRYGVALLVQAQLLDVRTPFELSRGRATTVFAALVNYARAFLTRGITLALKRTTIKHVTKLARGVISL